MVATGLEDLGANGAWVYRVDFRQVFDVSNSIRQPIVIIEGMTLGFIVLERASEYTRLTFK